MTGYFRGPELWYASTRKPRGKSQSACALLKGYAPPGHSDLTMKGFLRWEPRRTRGPQPRYRIISDTPSHPGNLGWDGRGIPLSCFPPRRARRPIAPHWHRRAYSLHPANKSLASSSPDLESTRMWEARLERAKQLLSASAAFRHLRPSATLTRVGGTGLSSAVRSPPHQTLVFGPKLSRSRSGACVSP